MYIIGSLKPSKIIHLPFNIEILKNLEMLALKSQTSIRKPFTLPSENQSEGCRIYEHINDNHESLLSNHNIKSLENAINEYKVLNLGKVLPNEHFLGMYTKHTKQGWSSAPIIAVENIYLPDELTIQRIYNWSEKSIEHIIIGY